MKMKDVGCVKRILELDGTYEVEKYKVCKREHFNSMENYPVHFYNTCR